MCNIHELKVQLGGTLSLRTLQRLISTRQIPFLKVGSRVVFEPARVKIALRRKFEVPAA
jgi:hypothetical protein